VTAEEQQAFEKRQRTLAATKARLQAAKDVPPELRSKEQRDLVENAKTITAAAGGLAAVGWRCSVGAAGLALLGWRCSVGAAGLANAVISGAVRVLAALALPAWQVPDWQTS
jgi:hypothetical protein